MALHRVFVTLALGSGTICLTFFLRCVIYYFSNKQRFNTNTNIYFYLFTNMYQLTYKQILRNIRTAPKRKNDHKSNGVLWHHTFVNVILILCKNASCDIYFEANNLIAVIYTFVLLEILLSIYVYIIARHILEFY